MEDHGGDEVEIALRCAARGAERARATSSAARREGALLTRGAHTHTRPRRAQAGYFRLNRTKEAEMFYFFFEYYVLLSTLYTYIYSY